MLREIVESIENNEIILQVTGSRKNRTFTYESAEIQDMIDNPSVYRSSENIPKWLTQAIFKTKYKGSFIKDKKRIADIIEGILNDVLKGEIQKIVFSNNSDGDIFGFENLDIEKYI